MRRSTRVVAAAAAATPPPPAASASAAASTASASAAAAAPGAPRTLSLAYERRVWDKLPAGALVVGVDEAGRGPLCGPVVAAAAAILHAVAAPPVLGIDDSKKINDEAVREELFAALTTHPAIVYGVGVVDHKKIDEINILQAAMLAMDLAVADLRSKLPAGRAVSFVFIDGPRVPSAVEADVKRGATAGGCEAVIKGDGKVYSIAAASVIAKVTRDRLMHGLAKRYPAYGWAENKGYGTASHMAAIAKHGPCELHRRSFAPMKHMGDYKMLAPVGEGAVAAAASAPTASAASSGAGAMPSEGGGDKKRRR